MTLACLRNSKEPKMTRVTNVVERLAGGKVREAAKRITQGPI